MNFFFLICVIANSTGRALNGTQRGHGSVEQSAEGAAAGQQMFDGVSKKSSEGGGENRRSQAEGGKKTVGVNHPVRIQNQTECDISRPLGGLYMRGGDTTSGLGPHCPDFN